MKKIQRIFTVFMLIIIVLAASIPLQADMPLASNWPMFRHDPYHTGFTSSSAPVTGGVLWKTEIGLPIVSSPAVVNKKVFFGVRNLALALDAGTGAMLWRAPMIGEIYGSPAVDPSAGKSGLVYIASYGLEESCKLSALDMNSGAVCWWTWMSTKSSPTVVNNWLGGTPPGSEPSLPPVPRATVYIGFGASLMAFDADGGKRLWAFEGLGQIDSTPAADEQNVYFGTNRNMIFAVNRYTGNGVWKFEAKGGIVSSPAVSGQFVVFGAADGNVYCLDKRNGTLQWTYPTTSPVTSSPAYIAGFIYFGSYGYLYKLDEKGKLIWRASTPGNVNSSPAVAAGKVYIGSSGSRSSAIFCLDDNSGSRIWSQWMMVDSSPAIADGLLFVTSTGGTVYAFTDWEKQIP